MLPGVDGLSVVREAARRTDPDAPCWSSRACSTRLWSRRRVELGASYLDKTEGLDALEAAIDAAVAAAPADP